MENLNSEIRPGVLVAALGLGLALSSPAFYSRGMADPGPTVGLADGITELSVRQELDRIEIAGGQIDVQVKNGAVRLSGSVRDQRERLAALLVATSAQGARVLIDDLQIEARE